MTVKTFLSAFLDWKCLTWLLELGCSAEYKKVLKQPKPVDELIPLSKSEACIAVVAFMRELEHSGLPFN